MDAGCFWVYFALMAIHVACTEMRKDFKYCVVGAGPSGLQLGYFFEKAGRDYIIFERNNEAGSFYKKYPRHRRLISTNKRFTGKTNKEFNLRHDWNSLLSDDDSLLMTRYSEDYYPEADVLVDYLNDFATTFNLNIQYNTSIVNIHKDTLNGEFHLTDHNSNMYYCRELIVCTGIPIENKLKIKGFQHIESYGEMPVNPKLYEGQSVLILGGGNAAFETANRIFSSTNVIHVMGRSRVRLAWSTHYVGDVRAINNRILDNYQLKSLDGYLEKPIHELKVVERGGKLHISFFNGKSEEMLKRTGIAPDNYSLREPYDRIVSCLGFKFDFSIFNDTAMPEKGGGKKDKYPLIKPDFESQNVPGLWFGGASAHSLDWRKSAGGFIHGYRYTVQALHRIFEWKNHGVKWPHYEIPQLEIFNYIVKRVNEASATYQMFNMLVDIVIYLENGKALYIMEYPVKLLDKLESYSGLPSGPTLVVNMEYGKEFSGPGRDTFDVDRATLNPAEAHISNFLHPVLYYYREPVKVLGAEYSLPKPDRMHHIVEDFLTKWTGPSCHLVPLRRFLEHIAGEDLREYFATSCFKLAMTHSTLPRRCREQYLHGQPLTGTATLFDIARAKNVLL